MAGRRRADQLLVERGLAASRARAQAAIEAGLVTADGVRVAKASQPLSVEAELSASPAYTYVSRGGLKLAAALDRFAVEAAGKVCLDVGASTGGFSEVLITRGAKRVYAVDVGHGQLHPSLSGRPGLVSLEGTDARALDRTLVPEPVELAVFDVSFISLKRVLPAALALCAPAASLVALIKPQFEAGRAHLKKGIVRDEKVQKAVCEDIERFIAAAGWRVIGLVESPIAGGEGNREFLIGARRG
ncbi:MAG TPA: TlyA family RNA methyltransferase [Xanthobacteraceae bacterium]|nr:TlyA family RNA methyltransferase [Xanthobacteraceae bacterium]